MSKTLKNALLVFAGGWCYGIMVPLVRVAHAMGYDSQQVMVVQYAISVLVLGIGIALFSRRAVTLKQVLQLGGLGIITAGVSFGYYNALALLSSAAAITLLFQFVWMGVLLQAVIERKLPSRMTVLAVALVLVGTVFAAGILEWGNDDFNLVGILYGMFSAVCYTASLYLHGRIATGLPTVNRTFFTIVGSLLVSCVLAPTFITSGAILWNFSWFSVPLALFGIIAPILLMQKGAPQLPSSVTTIMASSELPSGVLMGILFAGDSVTFLVILGVVIILGGIVLSQFDSIRPTQKSRSGTGNDGNRGQDGASQCDLSQELPAVAGKDSSTTYPTGTSLE
jgi:drug/metabolite transporter (DMT)-like permease